MSDLIRRRDAVSRMSELLMIELKGQRLPTWNEVYQAMNDVPSAEPEWKWIPCSERLPDWDEHRNEMVLVCYGNGSIRFDTCLHDDWVYGHPIAWMPLPEPYRGDE